MEEIEVVELEGKEYFIVSEIIVNKVRYIHLANVEDPSDFCIRKLVIENGEEILIGLDNNREFDFALKHFAEKEKIELNSEM